VYKTVMPSVVLIQTTGGGGTAPAPGGAVAPPKETLGSGVVVDTQGDILTARHVVHGASAITVTFADGTKVKAKVASETPDQDIAVLKTDQGAQVIVPATLGGGIQVGYAAFTVGNPLGLVDSLTAGVVSGLDRSIPVGDGTTLTGLIQFDAAVNPGSSGGPLLNRQGQVVGIVTALANPSDQGFFVGIGFAVPIATAGGAVNAPPR
jgi:S1-C subfamily serine protease